MSRPGLTSVFALLLLVHCGDSGPVGGGGSGGSGASGGSEASGGSGGADPCEKKICGEECVLTCLNGGDCAPTFCDADGSCVAVGVFDPGTCENLCGGKACGGACQSAYCDDQAACAGELCDDTGACIPDDGTLMCMP